MKQKLYLLNIDVVPPKWQEQYHVIQLKLLLGKKYLFSKQISFKHLVAQVRKQIKRPVKNDILVGFSIGGLISYILASELKFKLVVVASVSPFLEDNIDEVAKKYPEVLKLFSPKQKAELDKLVYPKPLNDMVIFYGGKEGKLMAQNSHYLSKKYDLSIREVKNNPHQLGRRYLKAISRIV